MPIAEVYTLGSQPRFSASFQVAGTDTDPTTTTFRYLEPDGTENALAYGIDAEVIRDATGRFHVDIRLEKSGVYYVRWVGTGSAAAASEYAVRCAQSAFTTPL